MIRITFSLNHYEIVDTTDVEKLLKNLNTFSHGCTINKEEAPQQVWRRNSLYPLGKAGHSASLSLSVSHTHRKQCWPAVPLWSES